jgi:O-antigen ligase
MLNISKTEINKNVLLQGLFYLVATFPLLDYGISAILLGSLLAVNLFVNGIKFNALWYFSIFLVYLLFISFYFSGVDDSIKRLSNSMLLLVTPIFLSSFQLNIKILNIFARVYISAIVLKSLICLFLLLRDKSFLFGTDIPLLSIEFHATYFSYEVFVAMLLIFYLLEDKRKMVLLIFLSIIIVLFQKKIAFVILFLCWIFYVKKSRQYYTLLVIPFLGLLFYIKSDFFEKIKIITEAALKFNLIGEDRVRLRLMEAVWYNFQEAPIFGKGAVAHTTFFYEYNLKHLGVWAQNYNTHNYFLFVLCSGGIFALILFIFPFLYSIIKYHKTSLVYAIFLIITMLLNLTESVLDRYNGVIIFVVFNFIFFSYYRLINYNSKTFTNAETK